MAESLINFQNPVIALAPMAGITDLPYRTLCAEFGADFTVAEMVSAKPDLLATEFSQNRVLFPENTPKIVQLLGSDPEMMAETAHLMEEKGADAIDINLGCPAKIVAKQLAGSALLADLKAVERLIKAVREALSIPLSIKTRLGYTANQKTIFEVGKMAEDYGLAWITVHGRTRDQRFNGTVNYEEIARFAEKSALPVIANGDIQTAEQALFLLKNYPFSGLMIGRASQGNPQIFSEIKSLLSGIPKKALQMSHIQNHIQALHELYGRQGVFIARKHLHHYFRPFYGQTHRDAINQAQSWDEQNALIQQYLSHLSH